MVWNDCSDKLHVYHSCEIRHASVLGDVITKISHGFIVIGIIITKISQLWKLAEKLKFGVHLTVFISTENFK